MGYGEPKRRPGRPSTGTAMTNAEKVRLHKARSNLVAYADPEDPKRRARLEKQPAKWMAYYLDDRFPFPFGEVHIQIIAACIRAMTAGTGITVAAPRGFGKTSVLWGMALYGVMTGVCRFPVVIGWKANAGYELLDQWLDALSRNERLRADYPCQCGPFQESTHSQRLKRILRNVETDQLAGCDVRKGRGTVLLPDVREPGTRHTMPHVALAGASMNGSIKGLNVGLITGESLRPDIVLMDDPQDEATADSETLVKKVIKKIDYGIRSLAGPRRRLTVMAAVTCVNLGDVSEHLLTRPGTESIKIGQVTSWPDGWHDEDSPTRAAWDEWNKVRLRGLELLDGGKRARAYYRANKAMLTKGMAVSWKHRFQAGDARRTGDPDAMFAAMWDFYDLGEMAFMAERQNSPMKEGVTVYSLTPRAITDRTDKDRAPGVIPDWVRLVVAATDINPSYALSTAVVGFGQDQRAAVLWYGLHKMSVADELPPAQKRAAIMLELERHGQDLADSRKVPCRPERWIIDGGGSPQDTVITFAGTSARTTGIEAVCAFGRAWRQSTRPKVQDRRFEQGYMHAESQLRRWVIFNADYWREVAQRAWTGAIGAPGTCDLPRGNHVDFAEQVCREQLAGKAEAAGIWVYVWNTLPGAHDFGDCMTMAFAAAAMGGIGTGGQQQRPQRQNRRRVRHVEI